MLDQSSWLIVTLQTSGYCLSISKSESSGMGAWIASSFVLIIVHKALVNSTVSESLASDSVHKLQDASSHEM